MIETSGVRFGALKDGNETEEDDEAIEGSIVLLSRSFDTMKETMFVENGSLSISAVHACIYRSINIQVINITKECDNYR